MQDIQFAYSGNFTPTIQPDFISTFGLQDYIDDDAPDGYRTAYTHFAIDWAEVFPDLEDPITAIAEEDHPELFAMAERGGYEIINVEAPTALKRRGIDKVAAFPLELLWRFYA